MIDFEVYKPSFEFYQKEYKGKIIKEASSFDFFSNIANNILYKEIYLNENLIDSKNEILINKMKKAQCNLSEIEFKYNLISNSGLQDVVSESAGKVTVHYAEKEANKNIEKTEKKIIEQYLFGSPLLYKGVSL